MKNLTFKIFESTLYLKYGSMPLNYRSPISTPQQEWMWHHYKHLEPCLFCSGSCIFLQTDDRTHVSVLPDLKYALMLHSCLFSKWDKVKVLTLRLTLKEYSLILTISFYDINQKILRKKDYFQNFSWFQFSVCKLCMIMYISTAP